MYRISLQLSLGKTERKKLQTERRKLNSTQSKWKLPLVYKWGQERESPPIFSNMTIKAVPTRTLVGHMSLLARDRVGTVPLKKKKQPHVFNERKVRARKRWV